jgi:hypothetical protein
MTGYVNQRRDFDDFGRIPASYHPLIGYHTYDWAPAFGMVEEAHIADMISHQRTRSYRSSRTNSSILDDAHQILVNNEEQFRWPFDTGHEFSTLKVTKQTSHPEVVARGYGNSYYRGPLLAADPVPFWTGHNSQAGDDRVTLPFPTSLDITIGTKFLRSTMPGKSAANLSQLILELIRDLPRIPFDKFDQKLYDRRNLPKNIGSEYLNTVFGWAPLVSDVLKVCEAIVKIDDIIAQYQRDAGPDKTVRRRREMDAVRTSSIETVDPYARLGFPYGPYALHAIDVFRDQFGNYPTQPNGFPSPRGTLTLEINTYEKYYFVARWMYYLGSDSPIFGELRRVAQIARKALGIRLDLELLWELAPWTWMLDWFVNIGDVLAINTAIASDSHVLQYAYLMRETQVSYKYTHSGVLFGNGKLSGPISDLITQRQKQRVRATPYGFGFNLSGLSATQLAILASLVASGYNGSKL